MKILILEDSLERKITFLENLHIFEPKIFDQAHLVIEQLHTNKWDVLFLDHDLGGQAFVSTDEKNTGSEVARYLKEFWNEQPRLIIIHSLNTAASKHMKCLLPDAILFPFAWNYVTSENLTEANIVGLKKMASDQNRDIEYGKL